jgi:hypothetical protein
MAALLVLIALALIAAAIIIWRLFASAAKKKAALGTISGGATPAGASISESWTTAPTTITTGTNATFVLTVNSSQISGLVPVSGRLYAFNVQPSANISIVSITPADPGGPNFGSTTGTGTITVVIVANSLPPTSAPDQTPTGVIVAKQVNAPISAPGISKSFTVQ